MCESSLCRDAPHHSISPTPLFGGWDGVQEGAGVVRKGATACSAFEVSLVS